MTTPSRLPQFLRGHRATSGWTQKHLADAAGLSEKTVKRAEAGEPVSEETLLALCGALDIPISAVPQPELLDDVVLPKPPERPTVDVVGLLLGIPLTAAISFGWALGGAAIIHSSLSLSAAAAACFLFTVQTLVAYADAARSPLPLLCNDARDGVFAALGAPARLLLGLGADMLQTHFGGKPHPALHAWGGVLLGTISGIVFNRTVLRKKIATRRAAAETAYVAVLDAAITDLGRAADLVTPEERLRAAIPPLLRVKAAMEAQGRIDAAEPLWLMAEDMARGLSTRTQLDAYLRLARALDHKAALSEREAHVVEIQRRKLIERLDEAVA